MPLNELAYDDKICIGAGKLEGVAPPLPSMLNKTTLIFCLNHWIPSKNLAPLSLPFKQ